MIKHGLSRTSEYKAWMAAKGRCHNPSYEAYALYGERGIFVCDRWRESFENFYADMGPKPSSSHTLDRIDNNGPYSPENCRWVEMIVQSNNTRKVRLVSYKGETHSVSEWARKLGITSQALTKRLRDHSDDLEYIFANKKHPRRS
jgi:hypothetical protein